MSANFVISQSFAVPRERMFALWTDFERLKQWFGPGGSFHGCMQSPD